MARRVIGVWNGVPVILISRADLIRPKCASGREQALIDARNLKRAWPRRSLNLRADASQEAGGRGRRHDPMRDRRSLLCCAGWDVQVLDASKPPRPETITGAPRRLVICVICERHSSSRRRDGRPSTRATAGRVMRASGKKTSTPANRSRSARGSLVECLSDPAVHAAREEGASHRQHLRRCAKGAESVAVDLERAASG